MEEDARDFSNFSWVTPGRDLGEHNVLLTNYNKNIRQTNFEDYVPAEPQRWVANRHDQIEDISFMSTDAYPINGVQWVPKDNFRYAQTINKSSTPTAGGKLFRHDSNNTGYNIQFANKSVETLGQARYHQPKLFYPDSTNSVNEGFGRKTTKPGRKRF